MQISLYKMPLSHITLLLFRKCDQKAPFNITKILTDNGTEFTDRFQRIDKKPSGNRLLDQVCSENNVDHRLLKPYHLQTNGMVKRLNGRISEMLKISSFCLQQGVKTSVLSLFG